MRRTATFDAFCVNVRRGVLAVYGEEEPSK